MLLRTSGVIFFALGRPEESDGAIYETLPRLKQIDESEAFITFRQEISEYLLGLWGTIICFNLILYLLNTIIGYAQRGREVIDQSMPWQEIRQSPATFITASHWPASISINDPMANEKPLTAPEVMMLYASIRAYEDTNPTTPYIAFLVPSLEPVGIAESDEVDSGRASDLAPLQDKDKDEQTDEVELRESPTRLKRKHNAIEKRRGG